MTIAIHLPQAEEGKRFCQFFDHRYRFIEANLNGEDRPEWKTISAIANVFSFEPLLLGRYLSLHHINEVKAR